MLKKLQEYDLQGSEIKKFRSVGPSYELDYNRISDEMFQLILDSKQPNGDFGLDVDSAYGTWESNNYRIDIVDEYGDADYDSKLYNMVETKFMDYKENLEKELMDKIYDLEYNDYVKFRNGSFYVKSTNDNDSYRGCMIWAGPDKDDDRGWYFYASDFIEVIEPSGTGERLFY